MKSRTEIEQYELFTWLVYTLPVRLSTFISISEAVSFRRKGCSQLKTSEQLDLQRGRGGSSHNLPHFIHILANASAH